MHFSEAKGHKKSDPHAGQYWSTGSQPIQITSGQTTHSQPVLWGQYLINSFPGIGTAMTDWTSAVNPHLLNRCKKIFRPLTTLVSKAEVHTMLNSKKSNNIAEKPTI